MTKVYFTKKHIIFASVIGVALVSLLLSFWLLLIAPKRKQVIESKAQLTTLKQASQAVSQELAQLQAKPNLLESDAVKDLPTIPNGASLEAYFTQLSKLEQELSVSLLAFNFNEKVLFPNQKTTTADAGANANATEPSAVDKQLLATDIGIELVSDKKENLLQFVGRLEKMERFLTVQSIEYRLRQGEGAATSCSASLVVRLYYLSDHETGKALKAE